MQSLNNENELVIEDSNVSIGLEVRKTANDAIISKLSASQLGYFKDDFITFFAHPALPNKNKRDATVFIPNFKEQPPSPVMTSMPAPSKRVAYSSSLPSLPQRTMSSPVNFTARRSPLINRGYYSRVAALDKLIIDFLAVCKKHNTGSQIVSLGAGFDTTYWRLKFHHNIAADRYVEVDFESSVAQKLMIIQHCQPLQDVLNTPCPSPSWTRSEVAPIAADENIVAKVWDDYCIVGADLRDREKLAEVLARTNIDYSLPTIFLSECVLVYMPPHASAQVIDWAANGPFTGPRVFATYEQIHPDDPFGR